MTMQNFGKIKDVFNSLLIESIVTKDKAKKEIFKKYLKALKANPILRTQFMVYENLENKIETDDTSIQFFVQECVNLLKSFKAEDIIAENNKLVKLLGSYSTKVANTEGANPLYEAISSLVFAKPSVKNIVSNVENKNLIAQHIKANKVRENVTESFDLPNSMLTKLFVNKFNDSYKDLMTEDKDVLGSLLDAKTDKTDILNKLTQECIDKVDVLLKEELEHEEKNKLNRVKEKLLIESTEIDQSVLTTKIVKLLELRANLK